MAYNASSEFPVNLQYSTLGSALDITDRVNVAWILIANQSGASVVVTITDSASSPNTIASFDVPDEGVQLVPGFRSDDGIIISGAGAAVHATVATMGG